jgi:hypothetical protein
MPLKTIRNVRIICDGVLKDTILEGVLKLGASGYSWWECHGKGEHEIATDIYQGLDRLYIEVWCQPDVAEKIVDYCHSPKFEPYGMTVGAEPLEVFESDKF